MLMFNEYRFSCRETIPASLVEFQIIIIFVRYNACSIESDGIEQGPKSINRYVINLFLKNAVLLDHVRKLFMLFRYLELFSWCIGVILI